MRATFGLPGRARHACARDGHSTGWGGASRVPHRPRTGSDFLYPKKLWASTFAHDLRGYSYLEFRTTRAGWPRGTRLARSL